MRPVTLLCLSLLLGASPALAQEPPMPPMAGMHADDHARFDARMAKLEAKLHLTAQQQPLWKKLVDTLKAQHEARRQMFLSMRMHPAADAPAHLDRRLQMLNLEVASVQQEKQALMPLWASLNSDQQAVLNKAASWHPKHGWGSHGHGGVEH